MKVPEAKKYIIRHINKVNGIRPNTSAQISSICDSDEFHVQQEIDHVE